MFIFWILNNIYKYVLRELIKLIRDKSHELSYIYATIYRYNSYINKIFYNKIAKINLNKIRNFGLI